MIKTTTWTPDTCSCTIVYEWDSTLSEEKRVHTPISAKNCSDHSHFSNDHVTLFNAILAENQGKNKAYDNACIAVPRLLPEHFTFSFDANRNLTLTISTLTPQELLAIKASPSLTAVNIVSESDISLS